MKNLIIILALFCSSCTGIRFISEGYIKNEIQKHPDDSFETLRIYKALGTYTVDSKAYIELAGFKYNSEKGLVIAVKKLYKTPPKFIGDNTVTMEKNYYALTEKQTKGLTDALSSIRNKIKSTDANKLEYVYQDYSVDKTLFISFRAAKGERNTANVRMWLYGEQYLFDANNFDIGLKNFLAY